MTSAGLLTTRSTDMASILRSSFNFQFRRPFTSILTNMSSKSSTSFLLAPHELQSAITASGAQKVVALDASWHMPNSPRRAREEWASKRLPGSRFLDLDELASPHELGLKHMMPGAEQFAKACGECWYLLSCVTFGKSLEADADSAYTEAFGITPDTHVVLYILTKPRSLVWSG